MRKMQDGGGRGALPKFFLQFPGIFTKSDFLIYNPLLIY